VAAIARNAGLLARATPVLLADQPLLRSFALALADVLDGDPVFAPRPTAELATALVQALDGDPPRRATMKARTR